MVSVVIGERVVGRAASVVIVAGVRKGSNHKARVASVLHVENVLLVRKASDLQDNKESVQVVLRESALRVRKENGHKDKAASGPHVRHGHKGSELSGHRVRRESARLVQRALNAPSRLKWHLRHRQLLRYRYRQFKMSRRRSPHS